MLRYHNATTARYQARSPSPRHRLPITARGMPPPGRHLDASSARRYLCRQCRTLKLWRPLNILFIRTWNVVWRFFRITSKKDSRHGKNDARILYTY